ncbi:hypothetical protein PPERSA_11160 [Pseudocohnilembus persalinus]|uniref:LSDAT prokaryote domain-containing protein n=1 Tax=Pseudocohnilembus persalinus TaxID=266149 RepID=A0A0V0QZE6_PSEPJ|nr:hypothetical protein PPERSA_11160 [Pseudocohnilembus persalinus]|eukprot:KRX07611.1 hypothetical protein PPERSA_11160 [Pseudocohnilembus persalinus]
MSIEESKVRFQDQNEYDDYDDYGDQYEDGQENRTYLDYQQNQWKAYDFLFPAGKLAKLVKVQDTNINGSSWGQLLYKLKLIEGYPIINLIGAKDTGRGQFLAGIARAAFNTDAIIIDSGISSGIEKYVLRRGVKLIGVAPEAEIKYPKINPTFIDPQELTNGHSHIFLLQNTEENEYVWSQEVWFKLELAQRLAEGRGPKGSKRTDGKPKCKIVHILLADTPNYIDELKVAVRQNQPIIVVKGSSICNSLIQKYAPQSDQSDENQDQNQSQNELKQQKQKQDQNQDEVALPAELIELMSSGKGHFFYLDSDDSEDIAQYVHFLLTVTPYQDGNLVKPDVRQMEQEEFARQNMSESEEENQLQQNNNNNINNTSNANINKNDSTVNKNQSQVSAGGQQN